MAGDNSTNTPNSTSKIAPDNLKKIVADIVRYGRVYTIDGKHIPIETVEKCPD